MAGNDPAKVYFTGKPCKRGHVALRQVSSKTCTECDRLAYHARAESRKASMKAWREANPERMKEAAGRWKSANQDRCRALGRKRRANKLSADGFHTAEDVKRIYAAQKGLCAECREPLGDGFHADHIKPLAKGGDNWPGNIQCLCPSCNFRKHARLPHEWAALNGRLL